MGRAGGLAGHEVGRRATALAFALAVLLTTPTLIGCGAGTGAASVSNGDEVLTVSAATTLKQPFTEIAELYEERYGSEVSLNFAASGVLQKQIEGGAPADLFASASPRQIEALDRRGLVASDSIREFASNRVALAVQSGSESLVRSFQDLTKAEVQRITTGNPNTAPHGTSSVEVLESLGILDAVAPKLVYAENAAQTTDYVARGEVDAGLVYASEAHDRDDVRLVALAPPDLHEPIRYLLARVAASEKTDASADFVAIVLSREGQAILEAHGFTVTGDQGS